MSDRGYYRFGQIGIEPVEPPQVEIHPERIQSPPQPALLAPEPVAKTIKAKLGRVFGFGNTMVEGKWSGLKRWTCSKCRFETFDPERAKKHRC